ncbi:MAG: glycoside hydrolase family 97 catalytic domain-containing protein [Planctomycetes bacterium]|nr:glycoside hydrolase family 97 catalytic domain-containing protein [Planctomycetota bacterium]
MPHHPLLPRAAACLAALVVISAAPGPVAQAPPAETTDVLALESPDRVIRAELRLPAPDTGAPLQWSVLVDGAPLLSDCRVGLTRLDGVAMLDGARLEDSVRSELDERIPVRFGRSSEARNHAGELRARLRTRTGGRIDVVFRCYDDAVAFRLEIPMSPDATTLRLAAETTSFRLVGDPTCHVQYLEHHRTSHEHTVATVRWSALPAGQLLDIPLTAEWPDGRVAAIAEAALRRYAGMALRSDEHGLRCELAPPPGARAGDPVVDTPRPMATPWRVVLIGRRLGSLLESSTLYCLNDPPVVGATDWIHPGKLTWPWWNGYLCDAEGSPPILSLDATRRYVDFCADHRIAFHAIVADESDSPWYHQPGRGLFPVAGTDATRVREDLDLAAHREVADSRGVGLWTWIHHAAVRGRTEEVFANLERLGFGGVMIDFLDNADQGTVEFAEEVLAAAARHRVLVHFHGMYAPTGLQRTFPNLMNHEGALNLEYLKWSDRCTPEHDLHMAFTRLIAGPMDYHLGGFRAVPRDGFRPRHVAPNVLGTRGHMLGMYVCFDNPCPMVADYPDAYGDQPGLEFIAAVPTWWDETRVLAAEYGRLLVTARRRGADWWVGGIGAVEARELELPLTFLGDGTYALRIWNDPAHPADPNALEIRDLDCTTTDVLSVHLAVDGGFAARLLAGS